MSQIQGDVNDESKPYVYVGIIEAASAQKKKMRCHIDAYSQFENVRLNSPISFVIINIQTGLEWR